jgi:hypothetical protein
MPYGRGVVEILSRQSGLNDQVEPIWFRYLYVVPKQNLDSKPQVDYWGIVVTQPHRCTRLLIDEH